MILALLLAIAFPSADQTAWMRPESFHLVIGMPHDDAMRALRTTGVKVIGDVTASRVVADYTDSKTLTLSFERNRLKSVRFELFVILHEAKGAFAEEAGYLRATF